MTTFDFPFKPRRQGAAFALLLTAALAASGAQATTTLSVQEYRDITGAIDAAVSARSSAPTRSLKELDRARDLLGESLGDADGTVLVQGTRDALQNARIAVARSQADLEAQAAQARGLLRKVMHDGALEALGRGEPQAVPLIGALADDFGLQGEGRAAVVQAARAGAVDRVRLEFERVAVNKMAASLGRVNRAPTATAYLETARATGWFNVVQDSPRAGDLNTTAFVNALESLTSGNTKEFAPQLQNLQAAVARFQAATAAALSAAPSKPKPTAAATPTVSTPQVAQPAASTPAPAPVVPVAPSTASLDALYAPLSRALVASGHGDNAAAREELTEALRLSGQLPVAVRGAPAVQGVIADVARVRDLSALRPADVRGLLGRLSNAELVGRNRPASRLESVSTAVNGALGGVTRAAIFLLLGVLALYPLYLLNLAFGGRNPYWRAIGVALALLLLPALLEGVASLGVLLEGMTGVAALGAVANVSVLQHPLGALLWALLAAGGVGLASWGFRGICLQFGLLGRVKDTVVQQPAVEWDEEI